MFFLSLSSTPTTASVASPSPKMVYPVNAALLRSPESYFADIGKITHFFGKTVTVGGVRVAEEKISYLKFGDHAPHLPSTLSFKLADKTDTLSYIYDKMGNICEIRENGRIKARYAYDALGRLIREDNRDFAKTEVFAYDNKGNILSRRVYPFSLKPFDELDELTITDEKLYAYANHDYWETYPHEYLVSFNGESCSYDAIGNPTTYRNKTLTWDRARLLSTFDGISFTYDGLGRCTQMGENTIAYDHNGNIVETNGLRVLYDHTGILGLCDSSYNFYYAKKDAQGNISALLDGNGAVVVKYKYDAWGKCKVLDAYGAEITDMTHIGNRNPFRYRGYYFDTNTGLYYLKSRFYDPETGRFLNADTIDYLEPDTINGLNLYAYCRNNPVIYSDPNGHSVILTSIIVGLIAGAIIGGTIGGVHAYNQASAAGATGWGLFGQTVLGVLGGAVIGAAIGATIGAIAGYAISSIGAFLSSSFPILIPTMMDGVIGYAVCNITGAQLLAGVAVVAGAGMLMFASNNRPGNNQAQNKQFRDAAEEAGFNPKDPNDRDILNEIHRYIRDNRLNLGWKELVELIKQWRW